MNTTQNNCYFKLVTAKEADAEAQLRGCATYDDYVVASGERTGFYLVELDTEFYIDSDDVTETTVIVGSNINASYCTKEVQAQKTPDGLFISCDDYIENFG